MIKQRKRANNNSGGAGLGSATPGSSSNTKLSTASSSPSSVFSGKDSISANQPDQQDQQTAFQSSSNNGRRRSSSSSISKSGTTQNNNMSSNNSQPTKPTHSQTMLLELLLTVTRASLMIITPLVAGMILRVGPSMLEPIYGSIFIEDHFLEYALFSAGLGVVLAMIYTVFISPSPSSTVSATTSTTTTKTTKTKVNNGSTKTENTTQSSSSPTSQGSILTACQAGLRKDAGLRKGIMVSLDLCALILAGAFLTAPILFKQSGDFGPWRGPHLTQMALTYPVLTLLGFANALACVLRSHEKVHVRTWMSCVLIQVGAILGLTLVVFQMAPHGQNCPRLYTAAILVAVISGLHKLLTAIHGEVTLPDERLEQRKRIKSASSHASLAISFIPLILVLAMSAHTATRNPQCQASITKAHNPLNGNYTILARNESVTGWISVVDEHQARNNLHIRIMRAGHSLIGGMYAETGDSIFGTFYIPEAVRLIKNRVKSSQETALQIGLGVGIASGSLTQLGVLVDVVEIDPVVADYASMYFDWPTPHQLFIQDGRQYIKNAPENKYDYVIHDVFTGGGVPPSLFSLEALQDIQKILKPDGVLAMNMVGSEHPLKSQALNSVRRTLRAAFPYVVAFKESPEDPDAYQNIVFFAAQFPIEFEDYEPPQMPTTAEEMEYWKSRGHQDHALRPSVMRDWILGSFQEWALSTPFDPAQGELILDRNNTLNSMQRLGAEDHWHAMRSLLPLDFWVNY